MIKPWRRNAATATAAGSRTASTSSVSAGRCSWCASWCSGPKRFTDLQAGLPNASPNVLSERLRELERAGIVRRRKLPPPAGSRVYELTDWGRELEGMLISLGRWAARSTSLPADLPIGPDSIALALRSLFDPEAATGLHASYELRLGEDRFLIAVADRQIDVSRAGAGHPDATIDTDPATLDAVLWGDRTIAEMQRSGDMRIAGDETAVDRLVRLFPLPEPAA